MGLFRQLVNSPILLSENNNFRRNVMRRIVTVIGIIILVSMIKVNAQTNCWAQCNGMIKDQRTRCMKACEARNAADAAAKKAKQTTSEKYSSTKAKAKDILKGWGRKK
jgi:hypothetical protein